MMEPIRGKIARILNSREVAINVGSDHGVRSDMYFDVIDPELQDITDPDTGVLLGSIECPKVRVKIVVVQHKFSLASTYKTKRVNIGGVGLLDQGLSQALKPPKWITIPETFKTGERTWENLDEKQIFVKIGDPVVQVFPVGEE